MVRVGVLALQGSFREHVSALKRCSVDAIEVRTLSDLSSCDGLIIPGGESTTMAHVAEKTGMLDALREFVKADGRCVWGTCAGLIFLARQAEGEQAPVLHAAQHFWIFRRQSLDSSRRLVPYIRLNLRRL